MNKRLFLLVLIGGLAGYYFYNKKLINIIPTKKIIKKVGNKVTEIIQYAKTFSNQAIELIQKLEGGFQAKAYPDAGGYSIGFGHYMGKTIVENNITFQRGLDLLISDLSKTNSAIKKYVKVPLTQNQYDAIASAHYNLGNALFWSNTRSNYTHFLEKLNNKDYTGAVSELKSFIYSQGKVNDYLVKRRNTEAELFLA